LIGLALLASLPSVREEALRRAERFATDALGREVRAESASLLLTQGRLELRGLRVAAGARLADGTLLSVDVLQARWSWTALLRRDVIIRELILIAPRLLLEPGEGRAIGPDEACALLLRAGSGSGGIRLEQARVERGHVSWQDAGGPWALEGVAARIAWTPAGDPAPAATIDLRIDRMRAPLPTGLDTVERIALDLKGTATELTVVSAAAEAGAGTLTATGRVPLAGGTPQLDLAVTASAPLASLLAPLGPVHRAEGTVALEGRLHGPWDRPSLQGVSTLTLGAGPKGQRLRLAVRGTRDRVEVETEKRGQAETFWGRLVFAPATRRYDARLKATDLDLEHLAGLPAVLADLFRAQAPSGLAGRLTADLNVTGQGVELAGLRGRGTLLVEGFRLSPDLPAGRLETRLTATAAALTLEALQLRVSGVEIAGRGTLQFQSDRLDIPLRFTTQNVGAISRGFGVPLVGGRATLTGRLTGTRSDPRFQGQLLWREALIATTALDRIEGEIEVAPRTLRTPRLVLRLGRTVATLRGSVTAPGDSPLRALDPKRDLRLDLSGEIAPGQTADLITLLPSRLPIQGSFRAAGRIAGTLREPTGEVTVTLGSVQVEEERWQQGAATLQVRPEGVEIRPFALRRGTEEVTGDLRIGRDGRLDGSLASTPMDLAKIGLLSRMQLNGRARFRLKLDGSLREIRVTGEATADALAYRGVRFGPAAAEFSAQPAGTEVTVTSQGGAYRLRLRLGPAASGRTELDLSLADADLLPLLRLQDLDLEPISSLRGSGAIRYREDVRTEESGTGEVDMSSLRLRLGDETWDSREPVALTWRGREVTLRRVRLIAEERDADIAGRIGPDGQADLAVKGRLPFQALAPWLGPIRPESGSVTANLSVRGPLRTPALAGTATVRDGRFALGGLAAPIHGASADLQIDGPRIRLLSFSGRCAEGALTGDGEAVRGEAGWSLRLAFTEDGGRIEQLLAHADVERQRLTGRLTVTGTLQGEGEAEAFLRSLNGAIRLSLENGRIGEAGLLPRVLSLLNIRGLTEGSEANAPGRGTPYRRASADVTVAGGFARTQNLLLEAPAASASAVGSLSLIDATLNADVAVRPLQNLDRFLAKIPFADWLLGGKEKGLIIAYYKVTGTLSKPEMTAQSPGILGRDLLGIFSRQLRTPEILPASPPNPAAPFGSGK
jgi:autotransporter translocation and assembly factor TamB